MTNPKLGRGFLPPQGEAVSGGRCVPRVYPEEHRWGKKMRRVSFLLLALLALPAPALGASAAAPAEKLVSRIDSIIATEKDGRVSVQVKGAVMGGGWKRAVLRPTKITLP